MRSERGVSENLEVVLYEPERPGDRLFGNPAAIQRIAQLFGLDLKMEEAASIEKALRETLLLDGLVSIWQGSD